MTLKIDPSDPPRAAALVIEPNRVRSIVRWRSAVRTISASGSVTDHPAPRGVFPPHDTHQVEAIAAAREELLQRFSVEFGSTILRTEGGETECTVWPHADGFATLLLKQAVHGVHTLRVTDNSIVRVQPLSSRFVVATNGNRLLWLSLAKREVRHLDLDGTIVDISRDASNVTVRPTADTPRTGAAVATDTATFDTLSLSKLFRSAERGLPDDAVERSLLMRAVDGALEADGAGGRTWWPIIAARNHQLTTDVARRDLDALRTLDSPDAPRSTLAIGGRLFWVGRCDSPMGFQFCPGPGGREHEVDRCRDVRLCPICDGSIDDALTTGHSLDYLHGCCGGTFTPALQVGKTNGHCRACGKQARVTGFGLMSIHWGRSDDDANVNVSADDGL